MRISVLSTIILSSVFLVACEREPVHDPAAYETYEIVPTARRQFEFDAENGPGVIRMLVEEASLGSKGTEIAEVWFPPGYHGSPHPHELEIIYVLEGELDHIVNGESHVLTPGMIGVVRTRDRVVHKTNSEEGVRVLIMWPLGNEAERLANSGMRVVDL